MTNSPKPGSSAGNRGKGRPRGVPNKTTALLKDALLLAAHRAGGEGGLVAYLQARAIDTPGPFLTLLGKVLPLQIAGAPDNPLIIVSKQQRDAAIAAATRADGPVRPATAMGLHGLLSHREALVLRTGVQDDRDA